MTMTQSLALPSRSVRTASRVAGSRPTAPGATVDQAAPGYSTGGSGGVVVAGGPAPGSAAQPATRTGRAASVVAAGRLRRRDGMAGHRTASARPDGHRSP